MPRAATITDAAEAFRLADFAHNRANDARDAMDVEGVRLFANLTAEYTYRGLDLLGLNRR